MIINSLEVTDNIQLERINGLHMAEFLKDCVYKNEATTQFLRDGVHIKGNVTLKGRVTIAHSNKTLNNYLFKYLHI